VLKRAPAAAFDAARSLLSPRPDAARDREVAAARSAFETFLALEAAHDPALVDLYAEDGVVIERVIDAGVERPAREFPLRRYKASLARALAVSRKANETSSHRAVSYEWVSTGWVMVRSIRAYTHSRAPAPYEAMLRRETDGCWRVAKEIAIVML
jgi:hypothetical protein